MDNVDGDVGYVDGELIQAMTRAARLGITVGEIATESDISRVTIWRWRTRRAPNWSRREFLLAVIRELAAERGALAKKLATL
jgi:orotate phosphoribosyltransferase-like protein